MNWDKLKEVFDLKTSAVFVGTPTYFATITVDRFLSVSIGIATLLIALLKLVEMFTGKKIAELIKGK